MECMRSFYFAVDLINNVTGATQLKQWATSAGQHFWQVSTGTSSTYNIEGFKNINVYGIDVVGSIQTQTNTVVNGAIVNDWSIDVLIGGQQPLVGASVTGSPNFYALDPIGAINRFFPMGKFSNSIRFESPFISTKFIQLGSTFAQGIGWETSGTVNLRWDLNFIVHYKFEGE